MTNAKFAGVCKDCKKEYAIGVEIHRNKKGSWCRDGEKCSLNDLTAPRPPQEVEQERKDNQQKRLDSQVNDQTAEMTAAAIRRVLKPCWKNSYEDACEILKETQHEERATLILAQVFFKEYSAHYRELLKQK
jgi:hypothetical protein